MLNGSNEQLETPTSDVVRESVPDDDVVLPVICFLNVNCEFDKLTSEILVLDRFEYNEDFWVFLIDGIPKVKDVVVSEVGKSLIQTPATVVPTPTHTIDRPSAETELILLYVSVDNPATWYLIIVSLLIPIKLFPGEVIVLIPPLLAVMIILSFILKFVGVFFSKNVLKNLGRNLQRRKS